MPVIQVGDVAIHARVSPSDIDLSELFPLTEDTPDVSINITHGFMLDGSQPVPRYNERGMDAMVFSSGFDTDYYGMFRHLGYLAGDVSEQYRFVHGAGFSLYGKGVLLIGRSGSGKSTLTTLLEGDVLDDDLLLVNAVEMRRLGTFGFYSNTSDGEVQTLDDTFRSAHLDYIFVLNKNLPPCNFKEIDPASIRPEVTFDDRLHPSLFEKYQSRGLPQFACKAYEVGTAAHPQVTASAITTLVSRSLG